MHNQDYLKVNSSAWNNQVEPHAQSEFYNLEGFINGDEILNSVELELLGDLKGKKLLHLQCHFGMDTLALARKGAEVTGIDFSSKAIEKAKSLANEMDLDANFICTDVFSVPAILKETFDVVFTSYGTIGWLPNAEKWANVISSMLKRGGQFVMVDFHPVVWMLNNDFSEISYSYFNRKSIVEKELGTYAERNSNIENTTITWNHSLADILGSLIKSGMEIKDFQEFDYSPYPCFTNLEKIADKKFQIVHLKGKIPMIYAINAIKK